MNGAGRIRTYLAVAFGISGVWIISIPLWKPFLVTFMGLSDPAPILNILLRLVVFYVAYNVSAVFSNLFTAKGCTQYNFVVSIAVNIVYYGFVYALFLRGVFQPGIPFICGMFGWGMVVNALLSVVLWALFVAPDRPLARSRR